MPARAASFRSVFAVAGFRRIWLAHLLSVAGDQLARVALTVLVFDRTSSAGWASAAYALTFVPDLLGGALGGIADRFSRRTVMVVTDVGRAVLIALMAVPGLPLPAAAALLFVVQLMAGPFHAARQAMLPDLLDPDRLVVGQAVISSTYQAGLVVGFGAGAAVVTSLGVPGALLIDAGTFALSALMLHFGLERFPPSAPSHHKRPSLIAGCRLVARDRKLRWLLLIACCCGFYVVPEGLAVPVAAELGGADALPWLLAANPVGSVLGGILLSRIPRERQVKVLGALTVASSLVLIPTGWAPGLVTIVVLWTLSGVFSAHDMITQTQYSLAAPAAHRGQVIGVAIAALRAAQAAGIAVAGLLAQLVAPTTVVTVAAGAGVVVACVAGVGWSRAVSSRRGPEESEDPAGPAGGTTPVGEHGS
ncbi:MFS transporter [Amycolatopsis sp. WAC 01375]|uniref:MFS transporter n=1 Tax=Amycolatopsis sp. WAC 01375 TaxID=2203194 RepID=UPI000F76C841|nr:MFS transporter [Amycolatopsis sp. WAC 01375]RSM72493.1 MFS transporter [Amycolatopsis sp. WAC 01375]